jgi:hypothetical protein
LFYIFTLNLLLLSISLNIVNNLPLESWQTAEYNPSSLYLTGEELIVFGQAYKEKRKKK